MKRKPEEHNLFLWNIQSVEFEERKNNEKNAQIITTQVESDVKILDFSFQILKEHVKNPRNTEF